MMDWHIPAIDPSLKGDVMARINNKTKPQGSLGDLEKLACQLAMIFQGQAIVLAKPSILVFAADHGIAEHHISIAGSEVTRLMVENFIAGGAAINCFCETNRIALHVIDAGIKHAIKSSSPVLLHYRIGAGTRDFSQEAAMTHAQAIQCLEAGKAVAESVIDSGCTLLGFGEMGIGNTSAASAILSAITGASSQFGVGRGTGIDDEQLALKRKLVQQGINRISNKAPINVLAEVGGFEIGQICGAMLTAASKRIPIVVDGFIVTAAAMLAKEINPTVTQYMIFAHNSQEPGHELMLAHLGAKPLLNLSLRLGEGTGAALAIPLVQCAASFYNDMASLSQANIQVG